MAERQRQARLHQAHQAEAQQRYRAQTMAAQHEALLREAAERAGGTKPPLSNKEKKRLEKQKADRTQKANGRSRAIRDMASRCGWISGTLWSYRLAGVVGAVGFFFVF